MLSLYPSNQALDHEEGPQERNRPLFTLEQNTYQELMQNSHLQGHVTT